VVINERQVNTRIMLFADDLVLCDESRDNIEERLEDRRRRLEDVA